MTLATVSFLSYKNGAIAIDASVQNLGLALYAPAPIATPNTGATAAIKVDVETPSIVPAPVVTLDAPSAVVTNCAAVGKLVTASTVVVAEPAATVALAELDAKAPEVAHNSDADAELLTILLILDCCAA